MADKTKRKLNVRLLRKIQQHILEEPRRFVMSAAVIKASTPKEWKSKKGPFAPDLSSVMPPCGTAACIAGWADILTGGTGSEWYIRHRAAAALGVPDIGSWCGHPLFSENSWPEPFRAQYLAAKTPKRRAEIGAARIDHFIKTKGAE
jgi:hypothetical protein